MAAAFQLAVTRTPGRRPSASADGPCDLGGQRLRSGEPQPHAVADHGDAQHLGGEPVLRRAVRRLTGRLDRDLPRVDADRHRAGGASVLVTAPPPSSSTRVSPSGAPCAVPVSTTAPVKSATNADRGAAASSLGVPSCSTGRRRSIATRSPSAAASAKSCVTSSAGTSAVAQHRAELARRARARAGVERRQRLVEQQHVGLARERARERHALALAARQRARPGVGQLAHPEALEQRPAARSAPSEPAQRVGDVLPRAQVREQRVLLEHVAAAAPLGRQVDAAARVEPGLAARLDEAVLGAQQPGGHAQHAGLARAGRPGQRQALAGRHLQRHVEVERAEPGARLNAEHRRAPPLPRHELHGQQDGARDGHQHRRQRERAVEVGAEAVVDRERDGLGDALERAGEHQRGAELAERAAQRERARRRPGRASRPGSSPAQKPRASEAPSVRDASSSVRSTDANAAIAWRT